MAQDLISPEFLDAIRERAARDYRGRLQQAFVGWFVEAEFGRADWTFTDDAGDGGIDAIVWRPGERPAVVILQSKFSERLGRGLLNSGAYREFARVVDAFRTGDEEFSAFLSGVREDVRAVYRRAHRALGETDHWLIQKQAFRIITTSQRRRNLEHKNLNPAAYWYWDEIRDLYQQYRKGQTPRARDLELYVEDKLPYKDPKRKVTSYLFNARVSDFRRYFDGNDVGRLVARNIRYNLAGKIGRHIRETYESDPNNFWYVHNGLTIICDDYVERDQVATLVNPSVVNGAQTLYAIATSPRKASPALVATRVVVRGHRHSLAHEDDRWVQKIIRGVNTQNRVRTQDFRSNEPEQLELQQLFRDQKVFYERKRGEWREIRNEPRFRNFDRTSLRTIGQVLTAVSAPDGSGVVLVKRGVETIFELKQYKKLFPSRDRIGRRFERIYLAYRTAQFVRKYAYSNGTEFRKQRYAFWTTVWLFHRGITSGPQFFGRSSVTSIRRGFDRLESPGLIGRRGRATAKKLREDIWKSWRRARRVDVEQWTAANFFKSGWGHRQVLRLALPKNRKSLGALAEYLFE